MKDILEEALEICAEYEDIDANGNANCWMRVSMLITEALQYSPQPAVPEVDEVVFDMLKAAQGCCLLLLNHTADKYIQNAIDLLSAGKETKCDTQ
jgi:hypothetical protein